MESVVLEKEKEVSACCLYFIFMAQKQAGERLSLNLLQTLQTLLKILFPFSEGASGFTARQQLQITDSALWQ